MALYFLEPSYASESVRSPSAGARMVIAVALLAGVAGFRRNGGRRSGGNRHHEGPKFTVMALAAMLIVVMILSTVHLGVPIGEKIWEPPKWLIAVQGLLEIFGYFLLVLIGVELLETLKAYVRKDVIHVRVALEVALIAMARKVIIEEPNTVPGVTCLELRHPSLP